jgi:acetyl-CoA C-acetyltransferase/acetyl-CoA acyltransferase
MAEGTTWSPAEPLALVAGARTPFAKAFTALTKVHAATLGQTALIGALEKCGLKPDAVDEVIFGNVAGPADSSNVSRVIALNAGVPQDRPAHTVNRNCGSGLEALFTAWQIIQCGRAKVVVAGGTESMSQVPLLWDERVKDWLLAFHKASAMQRLALLTKLRPAFLRPIPGLELGLTDPTCGLNMGQTAEILARDFHISRDEQDAFALQSHQRATAAWGRCFFKAEVAPVTAPGANEPLAKDVGPREQQTLAALAKLKPIFDRREGTVTAGNSCSITDGAAALVVMSAQDASARGLKPLGYLRAATVVGCEPRRMGLGPVHAIHRLLSTTGRALADFDLIEINEAFAAQVLGCQRAMSSAEFCSRELGRSTALGEIDPARLNVNGGAIALGHPVGASGARLVLTLLRSLKERQERRGIAALCIGGGQGMAAWVETEITD